MLREPLYVVGAPEFIMVAASADAKSALAVLPDIQLRILESYQEKHKKVTSKQSATHNTIHGSAQVS